MSVRLRFSVSVEINQGMACPNKGIQQHSMLAPPLSLSLSLLRFSHCYQERQRY